MDDDLDLFDDEEDEAMASPRFPKVPYDPGGFYVSNAPSVQERWLQFNISAHRVDVFYFGKCLYCATSVWAMADGVTLAVISSHAMTLVYDDDEHGRARYRACKRCAANEGRVNIIVERGRAMVEAKEDPGPLEWPAKHPMHLVSGLL
jgi:hypothetical protein